MTYSVHPEAASELKDAFRFYEEQASGAVANSLLSEVDHVAELLVANPRLGREGRGGVRSFPLRRFPYFVVYRPLDSGVLILALAHQHRLPGYWRYRS